MISLRPDRRRGEDVEKSVARRRREILRPAFETTVAAFAELTSTVEPQRRKDTKTATKKKLNLFVAAFVFFVS